jgi:hypothetical protein
VICALTGNDLYTTPYIAELLYFEQIQTTNCDGKSFARQRLLKTRFRNNKLEQSIAEQRLGKHRLKAGIMETDTELSILLGNGSCIHEEQ